MNSISRRAALSGAGGIAFGALFASLPRRGWAQSTDESAILLSLVYPNPENSKFDKAYFRDTHIPTLRDLYGECIERIELSTPREVPKSNRFPAGESHSVSESGPQIIPPRPPVLAAARLWIRDAKVFAAKIVANKSRVDTELLNVTAVTPIAQYERVVDLRGDARSTVNVGDQVSSIWFENQQGAKFDAQYYDQKIIPLMVKLYGTKAIRRIEFSLGSAQGGNEPLLKAAVHYYIRERAAWDAAGMQAGMQVMAETPNYTTMRQLYADMEISAIG